MKTGNVWGVGSYVSENIRKPALAMFHSNTHNATVAL